MSEMFAPPVALVAGSRPDGQLPAKAEFSRTVISPPRWGLPGFDGSVAAPWPHATSVSSAASRTAVPWILLLTWSSRCGLAHRSASGEVTTRPRAGIAGFRETEDKRGGPGRAGVHGGQAVFRGTEPPSISRRDAEIVGLP